MKNLRTTEERLWAVLAHLSALALGMGILLPIIGWSEQRRKSNYASFQCLQALGYQSLGFTVWLLAYLLLVILLIIVMAVSIGLTAQAQNTDNRFIETWSVLFAVIMFGTFGLYLLFPILAGVACVLGKDFRYPIMGKRLARYLGYDPVQTDNEQTWLIEDHEDRWVAAMGHFSVIIALWGMLAPVTAWILQGKRGHFLKFQSMQTLVFQGVVTLFYFIPLGILLIAFLGFGILMNFENGTTMNAPLSLFFLFGIMIFATILVLVVPLFQALGQWAGYLVLKGDNYRYPILGKLVEKRVVKEGHTVIPREQAP